MRYGKRSSFTRRFQELYDWVGEFEFSVAETQLLKDVAAAHESVKQPSQKRQRSVETVTLDGSPVNLQRVDWNGGWSHSRVSDPGISGDGTQCDILEVWTGLPSAEEFFQEYIRKGVPVIFREALQLQNHSLLSLFERQSFLESYGEDMIPVAQIPYADTFGKQQQMVNFQEVSQFSSLLWVSLLSLVSQKYISTHLKAESAPISSDKSLPEDPPLYAFNVPMPQWKERMQRSIFLPSVLRGLVTDTEMQFYLGGVGTGAPVHFHGHAVNSMAYGEKVSCPSHLCLPSFLTNRQRWILFPPELAFYSTKPSLSFFREDARVEGSLQCHQRSGDVMFVPSLWGHGTLNTRESIGVAHEFSVEDFCME